MAIEKYMAADVAAVIEETSNFLTNRLVMNTLVTQGKVSVEEAQYFKTLATEVLTEAAEEIIPDYIEVDDIQESAPASQTQESAQESAQEQETVVQESTEIVTATEDTGAAEATEAEAAEELTESEVIVNKLLQKLL